MPLYRLVIEGSGIRTREGAVGFFTSRTVKQPDRDTAELFALRVLREEWRQGVSAKLSPTKPHVKIVDCWQVGLRDRLRGIADTWHRFYEPGERSEAAAIEAAHARAPQAPRSTPSRRRYRPSDDVAVHARLHRSACRHR